MQEIWTIALRDWKKKDKLWKFFLIISITASIIFVIGFGIQGIISKEIFKGNYSAYFSFGIFVYLIFVGALDQGSEIILDKKNFIKLLLIAPISRYSLLLGKTLSLLTGLIKYALFLGAFLLLLNVEFSFVKLLFILVYTVFISVFAVATGLFFSSISRNKTVYNYLMGGLVMILLFLSGTFFPITSLPNQIRIILQYNPFIYIIDLFRYLMVGITEYKLVTDILVFFLYGIIIVFFGVYQFDKTLRK